MLRLLGLLVLAVIVLGVAWLVASLPGTLVATVGQTTVEMRTPVAVLAALVLFLVLYALIRGVGGLWRLPRRLRAHGAARRRAAADAATTRALVALAAGNPALARREITRARRLAGDTAQLLLLTAEASRLAGREDEAAQAFTALTARQDAAFLGYRGLLRQAMERRDWPKAAELARAAEAAHPGAVWLRTERARLAIRTGNWADALALADESTPTAPLAVAAAEAERDPARALKLARRAWNADPALAPAALAYARLLRAAGKERRAQAVLRKSWETRPHPDVAALALEGTAGLARAKAAQALSAANPDHVESAFLLARTALDAGLTGEARRHAERARAAGMNQRRLWLLLAEIEEAEGGETEAGRAAQRDALRHAAIADPDPAWTCTACNTTHAAWHPACPSCGAPGTLRWMGAHEYQLPAVTAPEPAPSGAQPVYT
ncbi:MAG TPA: heme biosynthesis HemY N-terminal domain-containing protein [Acetobacteraceae bacterium]|nr:heme biosynthesis HemY N-terminal domain-containing protein [Acetobacteraceae bacterium]